MVSIDAVFGQANTSGAYSITQAFGGGITEYFRDLILAEERPEPS